MAFLLKNRPSADAETGLIAADDGRGIDELKEDSLAAKPVVGVEGVVGSIESNLTTTTVSSKSKVAATKPLVGSPEELPDSLEDAAKAFRFWSPADGAVMTRPYALDTETVAISEAEPWTTPDYVLGAAFDGTHGHFVSRTNLGAFLLAHPDQSMIVYKAAFDLAVIHEAVPHVRIYDRVDQNRVIDTQVLHRLIKLATEGHTAFGKSQATLERCASEYLGSDLPKDIRDGQGNDVRTSYGQWLGRPTDEIEQVYLDYLAKDVVVTLRLFETLQARIETVLAGNSEAWGFVSAGWLEGQTQRWGWLTHHIQLKAAIVLKEISRNGLHLDRAARDERAAELKQFSAEHLSRLQQHGYEPGSGSDRRLQEILHRVDREHPEINLKRTRTGKYKADRETLADLAGFDPFFESLQAYREVEKLQSTFLAKMDRACVHPSFDVLKTTGRTSSFGEINAQNLPCDDRIRACFVPSPHHVLLDADYKTVELATLAQACLSQFRLRSAMAEAINAGQDLHRLVAAQVTCKDPDQVTDDERQRAKPINFGKPGGMGSATLRNYAMVGYGIDLTDVQIEDLTAAWFNMFPEMRSFLSDEENTGRRVAEFLELTPRTFAQHTDNHSFIEHPQNRGLEDEPHDILGLMCLKVMGRPDPCRQNGIPYSDREQDYFWSRMMLRVDDLPKDTRNSISAREPSADLRNSIASHICRDRVFTLTGRLRARATYCARHNTVFQGLAADGAKLGLWQLWRAGYRIVNFVHDQVIIEVPENADLSIHANRIQELMIAGMKQVVPDVRIDVEYAAARRWYKKAKPVFDEQTGALVPWEPEEEAGASMSDT